MTQSERNMIYLNISDIPVIKDVMLPDLYLLAWKCYEIIWGYEVLRMVK